MSDSNEIQTLTLAGLAHRCERETERFFQKRHHDPRFCFELFRRAILERDQRAWELVYRQYSPLVAGWVGRHSAFQSCGEEAQYFVNRAFEKLWGAQSPEKFAHFPNLKSLLRYLQMCVHSAIIDFVRGKEIEIRLDDDLRQTLEFDRTGPDVEQKVIGRFERQELWDYVNQRLNDDKERRVVYGSFALALKPRELYEKFPEMFRDVKEIYRIKENVMARLRRDEQLGRFLKDA